MALLALQLQTCQVLTQAASSAKRSVSDLAALQRNRQEMMGFYGGVVAAACSDLSFFAIHVNLNQASI